MSTAIMAWEKPALAKARIDQAIMDEATPRPRHRPDRGQVLDPSLLSPGELVVLRVGLVQAEADDLAGRLLDRDHRQVGAGAVAPHERSATTPRSTGADPQ